MRIKIIFSGKDVVFPNGTIQLVKGWFEHNILGNNNELHDQMSIYALTPMLGGIRDGNTERFSDGGYVLFSTNDEDLMGRVASAFYTKKVMESKVGELMYKTFENISDFHVHSDFDVIQAVTPIMVPIHKAPLHEYVTFKDDNFIKILTERCINKLIILGVDERKAKSIKLELLHPEKAEVINVKYKGIHNFANKVMLVVKGNRYARKVLYNAGIGASTGCGFGTVSILD